MNAGDVGLAQVEPADGELQTVGEQVALQAQLPLLAGLRQRARVVVEERVHGERGRAAGVHGQARGELIGRAELVGVVAPFAVGHGGGADRAALVVALVAAGHFVPVAAQAGGQQPV
ncbi:hypothetical protein CATMIT_01825, partial [Catenibacterium mitsuokai DSM 15897]